MVGAGIFNFLKRDCVIQFSLFPSFLTLHSFKDPDLVLPTPNPLPLMAPRNPLQCPFAVFYLSFSLVRGTHCQLTAHYK